MTKFGTVNLASIDVFEDIPITVEGRQYDYWRAMVNTRDKYVVSVRSDKYVLVQHADVMASVAQAMTSTGLKVGDVKPYFTRHGARMYCDILFEKHNITPKVGDNIATGVRLVNSVDGSTGVEISPYTLRYACTNGMTHRKFMSSSIEYHYGKQEEMLKRLVRIIGEAVESMVEIERQYKSWMEKPVSVEKILSRADMKEYIERIPKKYKNVLKEENPRTAWDMFNVLTQLNSHDESRSKSNIHSFDEVIEGMMMRVTT